MATIRVAVCSNRRPDEVAQCLDALSLQGGGLGAMLVCSALDEDEADAHAAAARAEVPGIEVLREPRPGLSHARNRALAACEDDDLLAFVDDDALVGPGWLSNLVRAWAAAPPRVACIGGPVRPRFAGRRPEWLTDPMLTALSMLDHGPEALDLDPFVRTVYGANISFRCGPLRAVGGFDPAFGHRGTRLRFSEEDEAQRALARAGHGVRYAPDVFVWHVVPESRVTRVGVLERRFHYGATLGARRDRSFAVALRHASTAALGAAIAAARSDEPVAMERAMRAVENAGVIAAPFLGRR